MIDQTECTMTDGTHAPAVAGHDMCPPCEARFDEIRNAAADDHGPGCDGPLNCTCGPTTGYRCVAGHVSDHYVAVAGSVSPGCPVCGRFVTQVEDTDGEPF